MTAPDDHTTDEGPDEIGELDVSLTIHSSTLVTIVLTGHPRFMDEMFKPDIRAQLVEGIRASATTDVDVDDSAGDQ